MRWLVPYIALFTTSFGFLLDREVCYKDEGIGCFTTDFPWRSNSRPVTLLPASPANIDTRFFLYTRTNPGKDFEQEILYNDPSSIRQSNFNGSYPTKFIIHGFAHNAHRDWVQKMTQELLQKDAYNVIAVDWRAGAGPRYMQSVANTRVVGALVAKVINLLVDNTETTPGDIHVIGHNMGGHIAGYAGTAVPGLGRITGLDPVRPLFEGTDQIVRLDPSDAKFVDVIHTDTSSLLSLGFGTEDAVGHVDFYPNGGHDQPGCPTSLSKKVVGAVWSLTKLDQLSAEAAVACNHARACDYFTESINSRCPFNAFPCSSYDNFVAGKCLDCTQTKCSRMGLNAELSDARGRMYLQTQNTTTFCNRHYFITLVTSKSTSRKSPRGLVEVQIKGDQGQTSKIALTSKDERVRGESNLGKMITSRIDLGKINNALVEYTKYKSVSSLLYNDFLDVDKVEVQSGEHGTITRFCANNLSVGTSQARTLTASTFNC